MYQNGSDVLLNYGFPRVMEGRHVNRPRSNDMSNAANFVPNLLQNSTTKINRASYVRLTDPATAPSDNGRATTKSSFAGSLRLQPGEVDSVLRTLAPEGTTPSASLPRDMTFWSLLRQYEGAPLASGLPPVSSFTGVAPSDLIAFGEGLVTVRNQAVERFQQDASTSTSVELGTALILLNTAQVTLTAFTSNIAASPVGMLNLERLEMTPVGIERGGLIATVPLAPKERTFVVQKEWSVTTQEFTSIVTDSLENFSETGVTENTQLTQATTSQVAHGNQFNVTASASGGIGFVSGSSSVSFGSQDSNSQSATASRQNSIQTTRLASSRVKQSHKTTISTTTTEGTSQATTRKLENPSQTDPMRIDYYSMMRKWYVALYRYGLRLTYDITVPEPGATLREVYAQLDILQKSLSDQFTFSIKHSDITADVKPGDTEPYYLVLADEYSVDAPPPPSPSQQVVQVSVGFSNTDSVNPASFTVPDGYWIDSIIYVDYHVDESPFTAQLLVEYTEPGIILTKASSSIDLCSGESFLWHQSGKQQITLYYYTSDQPGGHLDFNVNCVPTDTAMAQWQSSVWTALYNAAQSQFYAQQQAVSAQITALQNTISNVDTLTLRREENDEIMKCVLRWLLGPQLDFAFMPATVQSAFQAAALAAAGGNTVAEWLALYYGVNFTGNQTNLSPSQWSALSGQEDVISFINQAIEWENITFFTYSYFWDYPLCWDFIRQIQHDDKTRQAFLRAGSARVVLTVRQGWELAWTYFVNTGSITLPSPLPPHPYMTIAQQIAAYDSTNYPGIPPANPDGGGLIDDDTPQTGATGTADIAPAAASPSTTPVPIPVDDATGFVVGATAIIDTWDAQIDPGTNTGPGGPGIGAQETQTITAVDTSSTPQTVTVQGLQYSHYAPFPVVQAGAKGLLIGEWFEYTPTSGTDIGVTINPAGPMA
jgi:hypothetical protein